MTQRLRDGKRRSGADFFPKAMPPGSTGHALLGPEGGRELRHEDGHSPRVPTLSVRFVASGFEGCFDGFVVRRAGACAINQDLKPAASEFDAEPDFASHPEHCCQISAHRSLGERPSRHHEWPKLDDPVSNGTFQALSDASSWNFFGAGDAIPG
jgi:hypothetical protein